MSDPLFKGFNYLTEREPIRYTERVRRGGLLGALGLMKTEECTVSSASVWAGLAIPDGKSNTSRKTIERTNCKNCAAPMRTNECDYCETVY